MERISRRQFASEVLTGIAAINGAVALKGATQQVPAAMPLKLELQRRDPVDGHPTTALETVSAANICVLVVDMWNYHWCSTWVGRAGAMIPRMNRALQVARELGMTVVFAPTDCSSAFAGTPQRETMAAIPQHKLPAPIDFNPTAPWSFGLGSGCMCGGPYPCLVNYGQSAQDPRLVVTERDLVSSGGREVYDLCKERGLTHIVYMGGATNMCLVQKPEGMIGMTRLGLKCILARDLTEAHGPNSGSDSADKHTAFSVAYIEKLIGPSIDFVGELRKIQRWDDGWAVDPVLIAPWAFRDRPKFFDDTLRISMSAPRAGAPAPEIRYTLDGSGPGPGSRLYSAPFEIHDTTLVRAVAFRDRRTLGPESESYYVRIPPKPLKPDVHISDLQPFKINMAVWASSYKNSNVGPQMDKAYGGTPLTARGATYAKGVGLRAPSQLIYQIKPEYGFFVGQAGVDEALLAADFGRERALYTSVIFKVFIDGKLQAQSPLMRISQEPWRFQIKIPKGTRVISLAATDGGDGNREDLIQWLNAGFLLAQPPSA